MSRNKTLTRAEIVRQRRQAMQRRRYPKKKKGYSKAFRDLPPITSRGVINDIAVERINKTRRRRFNTTYILPHSLAGDVAFPKFQIRWRYLSFILLILLAYGLYWMLSAPEFRIGSAEVEGNQRISAEEINDVLGIANAPIFFLMPDQLESHILQSYPELLSVDVNIALPNHVTVQVTERQPAILWKQDDGFTWIDNDGFAFRPRGEAQGLIIVQALAAPPKPVPSIDNSLPPFITTDLVKALKTLASYLPPETPIAYDPITGLSWNDSRGWRVQFGPDIESIDMKIHVYQAMVDWITKRRIQPILIDISHPGTPYYRIEQSRLEE